MLNGTYNSRYLTARYVPCTTAVAPVLQLRGRAKKKQIEEFFFIITNRASPFSLPLHSLHQQARVAVATATTTSIGRTKRNSTNHRLDRKKKQASAVTATEIRSIGRRRKKTGVGCTKNSNRHRPYQKKAQASVCSNNTKHRLHQKQKH